MKACPKCGKRFLGNEEFCPSDGETLLELDEGEIEDPLVGTTVDGRYSIERKLGEGGMGVVYLATHAIIGKKCALKVLRGELNNESEVGQRFVQEAQSAAAIGNEHIIEITDFGQLPDGSAYFVMEFLDGAALHDVLEENPKVEVERVLDIMLQCCEALGAAHNSSIVHRDLKPDNIFLVTKGDREDFVKVLDFGIAKVASQSSRLTKTGMIFGTPQYMSPEQAAGTGVDARTDIYSLGIIMYEMLCGHVPFEADTFMGVLTKHLYEEPIPPRRLVPPVDVRQDLEAVLLKAISKKADRRYQSMKEFAQDLQAIQEGRTPEIVFDQVRDDAMTTIPPPPPSEVVGGKSPKTARNRDDLGGKSGSKLPVFIGIGAAVVVAAGVAAFLMFGGTNPTEASADAATDQLAVNDPGTQVPAEEVDTGEAPEPEEVKPEEQPAEEVVVATVKVMSVPEGASLYKDEALMGKLPFDLVKPKVGEQAVSYVIKLDGYKDLPVIISSGTPDLFELTLEKQRRKHKKSGSSSSSSSGSSSSSSGSSSGKTNVKVKKKKSKHSDLADPWAS